MSKKTKNSVARLTESDERFLEQAAERLSLPKSEIVRRSIRLLRHKAGEMGGFSFLFELNEA